MARSSSGSDRTACAFATPSAAENSTRRTRTSRSNSELSPSGVQRFIGPVLDVFFGARVARQPMTTNAIRTASKIPNSSVSFMLFSDACMGWHQVSRGNLGSLGLCGLSKWSILNRLILSMRARFSAVRGAVKLPRSGLWQFRQVISTQFRQATSTKNTRVTLRIVSTWWPRQKIRNRVLLTAKWRPNG